MEQNVLIIMLIILLVVIYLYQIKYEKFENDSANSNTKKFKYTLLDGNLYLKLEIIPVINKVEFTYTKDSSEPSTNFILEGNYIKTFDNKYIKINSIDKTKFKVSDTFELENIEGNEYWTPLLLFINKVYYETCPRNANCYYRCFLNTKFNDNGEPEINWNCPADPKLLPITNITFFDLE
jgi:hypothetical protein